MGKLTQNKLTPKTVPICILQYLAVVQSTVHTCVSTLRLYELWQRGSWYDQLAALNPPFPPPITSLMGGRDGTPVPSPYPQCFKHLHLSTLLDQIRFVKSMQKNPIKKQKNCPKLLVI